MRKLIFITIISSFAFQANSEVFNCGFTEPFISFSYNTSTQKLVEKDAFMNKSKTHKNVSFQIKDAGIFLLKNKAGNTVAEITLNKKGSDGMSDAVFPYEASYKGMDQTNPYVNLWGGCVSSLQPMIKLPDETID